MRNVCRLIELVQKKVTIKDTTNSTTPTAYRKRKKESIVEITFFQMALVT